MFLLCFSIHSVPAIFIGLSLHKAFVPSWATWVITAFVLFHLIIELLLEIHGCLNARKQQRMYISIVIQLDGLNHIECIVAAAVVSY